MVTGAATGVAGTGAATGVVTTTGAAVSTAMGDAMATGTFDGRVEALSTRIMGDKDGISDAVPCTRVELGKTEGVMIIMEGPLDGVVDGVVDG